MATCRDWPNEIGNGMPHEWAVADNQEPVDSVNVVASL